MGFFFLMSGKKFFRLPPPLANFFRKNIDKKSWASSVSQGNYSRHPPKQKGLVTPLVAPNGNERLQLCADLENAFLNDVPTPIHYCRKIILQPEELLLYSLVNIALPPGTKLGMRSAEKYAGISLAIYKVYGVCFWSQYALSSLEESERS